MKWIRVLSLLLLLLTVGVGYFWATFGLFVIEPRQNSENGEEEPRTTSSQPAVAASEQIPMKMIGAARVEVEVTHPPEKALAAVGSLTTASSIAQVCPSLPGGTDEDRARPRYLWAALRHLDSLHETSERLEGPFELPITESLNVTLSESKQPVGPNESNAPSPSVCPMNTSVPLVPFKNRRGKTRMRRYNQTCAQHRAPNNGFPMRKSSYIFHWKRPAVRGVTSMNSNTTQASKRRPSVVSGESPSVAVCLFGQIRRLQQVGRSIFQNVIVNNKADTFATTWPYPDDGGLEREIRSTAKDLRNHFHEALRAVRVELFHPSWKSNDSPFLVNSVYMYFMAEGCLHLMDWVSRREGPTKFHYQYIIRSRLDLRFDYPITIVLPSSPKSRPTHPTDGHPDRSVVGNSTAQTPSSTAKGDGWKVKLGTLLLNVPASHLLMHDYTLCCINDWTTVGPAAEMRATFAVYSMVMAAHRCQWNGTKLHHAARWCHGESCFQRSLVSSNISWVLANLGVSIGDSTTRKNLNKPVCENQQCRYA